MMIDGRILKEDVSDTKEWYYCDNKYHSYGPYSLEEMKGAYSEGLINEFSPIKNEKMKGYLSLKNLDIFKDINEKMETSFTVENKKESFESVTSSFTGSCLEVHGLPPDASENGGKIYVGMDSRGARVFFDKASVVVRQNRAKPTIEIFPPEGSKGFFGNILGHEELIFEVLDCEMDFSHGTYGLYRKSYWTESREIVTFYKPSKPIWHRIESGHMNSDWYGVKSEIMRSIIFESGYIESEIMRSIIAASCGVRV